MSFRLRIFSFITRVGFKSVLRYSENVSFIRKHFERIARSTFRKVPDAVFSNVSLCAIAREVPTLKTRTKATIDDGALLYIHGGGFVFGSSKAYRNLGTALSARLRIPVFLPDYRLAPEHPFPQGLNDIKASYQALLDKGIDPAKIAVGGDSAGGNLVLGLISYLIAEKLPLPACSFVISPVTDFTFASPSLVNNARSDAVLAARKSNFLRDLYLQGHDPKDPDVSPVFGNFRGAPPMLIHASTKEILRDDAYRITEVLADQKVDVRARFWGNNYHVFHLLHGRVPEADAALDEIATFVLKHLPSRATES